MDSLEVTVMSLDFPAAPSSGQTHTEAGLSWRWLSPRWTAATPAPPDLLPPQTLVVISSETLPAGFTGTALVEAAAPLTVTLPPAPSVGQTVTVKDALGNAGTYPITITGDGPSIEGVVTLVLQYNYSWVNLIFTGSQWVQT
jgi:hypothetical protein